jgi:monoamine oxidase
MEADVIVLGGGVAGLAAAHRLGLAGRRVQLLEARGRLGGRIHTLEDGGEPVELGAEFVHGEPTPLVEFCRMAGLEREAAREGRIRLSIRTERSMQPDWVGAERLLARLDPGRTPDRSVAEFLATDAADAAPSARRTMTSYLESFQAAAVGRLGERGVARAERGEATASKGASRIRGGYGALVRALIERLAPSVRVELGAEVRRVRWSDAGVEVETAWQGATRWWRARHAVVSLPLGVLQAEAVAFEPPLERDAALARLEPGTVVRVALRFRRRWWPAELGFAFVADAPRVWWTPSETSRTLTGWSGGPGADELRTSDADGIRSAAVAALAFGFGRDGAELEGELEVVHWHDWTADPYSRGAYASLGVGGVEAVEELALPLGRTLYFAGEHTETTGEHGSVHGALATGFRAADEILRVGE